MRGMAGNPLGRYFIYVVIGFSFLVGLTIAMAVSLRNRPGLPQPKTIPDNYDGKNNSDTTAGKVTPRDAASPDATSETPPLIYEEPEPPPVERKFLPLPFEDIEDVKFGMTGEEMEAAWGAPDAATEDGERIYLKRGMIVKLDDDGQLKRITCVSKEAAPKSLKDAITPFEGKTPEGIGMGATVEDIVATYGPPDLGRKDLEMDLPEMRLQYFKGDYIFMIVEGRLVKFTVAPPIVERD